MSNSGSLPISLERATVVSHYQRDFPVARPPYTEDREPVFEYDPDSMFHIPLSNGESEWITLDKTWFLSFQKGYCFQGGIDIIQVS